MDFIRTMEEAVGKKAILEMYPMQKGDVRITYADTSKLDNRVGYKPETALKSGIGKFITWYQQHNF
jgi:UDP-glucuronate 4-epimerase